MNPRRAAYFFLESLRGLPEGRYFRRFLQEDRDGIPPDTTKRLLVDLLAYCKRSVPYYAEVMRGIGGYFDDDPESYLRRLPILTKEIIRNRFDDLKSVELGTHKWHLSSSGGSTGEPVRIIRDFEGEARTAAISFLYSLWAGCEIAGRQVRLWGSERDIIHGHEKWGARLLNDILNVTLVNAFNLDRKRIFDFIALINAQRPKLIVAYAQSLYDVARYCEREGLEVRPQEAIITSAETLYPFMRETIARVFRCRVFNRYGSREVGAIAGERPGYEGLWVAPWGCHIEIVDSAGQPMPDGAQGEILVTSLTNYAMPLVRYKIGDIGILCPKKTGGQRGNGQVLQQVFGRITDTFITRDGALVYPGFFASFLSSRNWILKFQIIQKSVKCLVFRIVLSGSAAPPGELNEIAAKTRLIMGDDSEVIFEFVEKIVPGPSGKHRYEVSEVTL